MAKRHQDRNLHASRPGLDQHHGRPSPLPFANGGLRSILNLTQERNICFWLELLHGLIDAELLGRFRGDQGSVVPRKLGNRVRSLLQPAIVYVAPIPYRSIRKEVNFDAFPAGHTQSGRRVLGAVRINALVGTALEISVLECLLPCHVAIIVRIFWEGKCLPYLGESRGWFLAHSLSRYQGWSHHRIFRPLGRKTFPVKLPPAQQLRKDFEFRESAV